MRLYQILHKYMIQLSQKEIEYEQVETFTYE